MDIVWTIVQVLAVIPIVLLGAAFLRAYVAKVATGKWPHQCEESRRIYLNLP